MMSHRDLDELPDIPIAGRQIGDTDLLTIEGVIHLRDCQVWKTGRLPEFDPTQFRTAPAVDQSQCSCGAKFAKPSEFVERKVGD